MWLGIIRWGAMWIQLHHVPFCHTLQYFQLHPPQRVYENSAVTWLCRIYLLHRQVRPVFFCQWWFVQCQILPQNEGKVHGNKGAALQFRHQFSRHTWWKTVTSMMHGSSICRTPTLESVRMCATVCTCTVGVGTSGSGRAQQSSKQFLIDWHSMYRRLQFIPLRCSPFVYEHSEQAHSACSTMLDYPIGQELKV